ncbi:hypothetical protein QYE76_022209 [Lolium multiflorum]|uniref:Uncharacterized protein n=1 Tax=Lolium multiflorum TaxID=4521 RepID=A0AAD8RAJ4_LOLMU|nr:hypothetical protein QYE76_022209 [Lolium multiflorum]
MGKKKISTTATDATSSGAAAKSGANPPKRSTSHAPPLAPAPPAPSSSAAGSAPGDWPASTTTKRDEKKAKSLGYIPSEEGNVILPDFIEPPPKKSRTGAAPPDLAASEASAPATIPVAQMSTASSLSKGKNIPSADVAAAPPSGKPDLRAVISSESLASHYASLEVDKAQLQKEVESSSSKLEGAIKIVAEARTEIDTLKEELKELKQRLKDEEATKLTAEARALEKDELLRQSSLALLSNVPLAPLLIIAFTNIGSCINVFFMLLFFSGAADIPVEALDKVPSNSPSNALSMTLASHQLAQDLLEKGKGAMAWIHTMIFPRSASTRLWAN